MTAKAHQRHGRDELPLVPNFGGEGVAERGLKGFCGINCRLQGSASRLSLLLAALLSPFSLATAREPWSSSRIFGSPEPPKPFIHQQAFPRLQPFNNPLEMIAVPGTDRLAIIEAGGKAWSFINRDDVEAAELMIDLKALRPDLRYAYGIAFHPRHRENREIFLCYAYDQNIEDGTKLSRFRLASLDPPVVDPRSEELLLAWRSGGHNGACLRFGPDGMLYITTGDAEVPSPPDPLNTGQDLDDFLSCILRIDVDRKDAGKNYRSPPDNPFAAVKDARPEIWAFGFRNPWKISFDPASGNLWCGDVGWQLWEMIHLVKRGGNHGWSAMEAAQPIKPELENKIAPISPPVVAHPHTEAASITGGFVYHGKKFPELAGAYIYGDYETGKIWALWHDGQHIARHEEICDTPHKIVTFGEDAAGELFYIHYTNPGTFHRLERNPNAGKPSQFPRRLSETGLFADARSQQPAAGVFPFEIRAPMWTDGASGQRFIGLTGAADTVETNLSFNKNKNRTDSKVAWPANAVLAKTLSLRLDTGDEKSAAKIETQVLHFDGESWNAYSYRWNEAGTDADLVPESGGERIIEIKGKDLPGGKHRHTWRFNSRAECMRCHNLWNPFVLGFQPQQLTDSSLQSLAALGIVDENYAKKSEARLVNPYDETPSAEERARSWLHANCAQCHREHGGGSTPLLVNAELRLDEMFAVSEKPVRGDFGMADARIIVPGSPWKSVLLHRIATSGAGHMPPVGPATVDGRALGFFAEWIMGLGGQPASIHPSHESDLSSSPESAMQALIARDLLPREKFDAAVQAAAKSPNAHIRSLFERFLPDEQRAETMGASASIEKITAKQGDAKRGAELLLPAGKAAICLACHFLNGQGRDFGPDLSKAGSRLNRGQIIESLLQPSKTILPPYLPATVMMKDGSSQTGFIVLRTAAELHLKLATTQSVVLKKADVKSEKALPVSLMPEGLLQSFTAQEAADMVEFLAGLK